MKSEKKSIKIINPLTSHRVKIKPAPDKRDKMVSTGEKPFTLAQSTMVDKGLNKKISTGVNTDLAKEDVVKILIFFNSNLTTKI